MEADSSKLLVFLLGVVSPYAVVEGGGEAQPRQVGRHEQSGSAADAIPGPHGGSNGAGEKHELHQSLKAQRRDNHLPLDAFSPYRAKRLSATHPF